MEKMLSLMGDSELQAIQDKVMEDMEHAIESQYEGGAMRAIDELRLINAEIRGRMNERQAVAEVKEGLTNMAEGTNGAELFKSLGFTTEKGD